MATFKNAELIRIIPDQPGRGGSKTSLTSQSINLDIYQANDVLVYYGRWRRNAQLYDVSGTYPPVPGSVGSFALHNFTSFDTTNAALPPVNKLLSHNLVASGATHTINQHNPAFTVKSYSPGASLSAAVPATFLNIKNRCFMCWGATNNFIYDSTHGVVYDVGIDAPVTAATYSFGGVESYFVFATPGGTRLTLLNAAQPLNPAVKFVTISGQSYPTRQPTPTDLGPFAVAGTAGGTAGTHTITITGFNFPLRDYNGLTLTADSNAYVITDTVISGANTTVTTYEPVVSTFSGVSYTVTGRQIVLAKPYVGQTNSVIVFMGFLWTSDTVAQAYSGPLSWDTTPPQYAYAYYDDPGFGEPGTATGTIATNTITINGALWGPVRYNGCTITVGANSYVIASYAPSGANTIVTTVGALAASFTTQPYTLSGTLAAYGTGHISDISPVTFVTEQKVNGVSVTLSDIIPSGAVDQPRFNKIQIFRSILAGGGFVYFPFDPSVGLIENVGTAPLSFTDIYDDSLLLSTQVSLVAPTVTNRKPPPFAHQAYWDGRVFGNPVNDPSAVVFSGDIVDILYGVPEECYPSANIMRIPSDDGRVTGMALMGPLLIITTERYAYYPTRGPNAADYRLVRFSTTMNGVGDKQMIEFAGPTVDDSDAIIYLAKDKRFYLTAPSIGNIPMSEPIQDVLSARVTTTYVGCRVANVFIQGNQYLIVSVPGSLVLFVYDFNRKIWTFNSMQTPTNVSITPQAFATVYGTSQPVQFLMIFNGAVYEWLGPNNTVGIQTEPYVTTMPLSGKRKSHHRINFVRIYVSTAANRWVLQYTVDETPDFSAPNRKIFVAYQDQLLTIQPSGSTPVDAPGAKELIYFPNSEPAAVIDGHRFQIKIIYPESTDIEDLYAIDLCLSDLEPSDETSI